jgi:elongation factor Ts
VTEISAALVKELRDQTGAGMMDCKRALEESGGDIEAAVRILRERGAASAAKRAGRETPEGIVLARIENGAGTLAAIGCETEPVSKNDEFRAFAERVLDTAAAGGDPGSLEEERQELVGKIGENVAVVGTARMEAQEGELLAEYVHPPANKIGVLVKVRGTDAAAARRLAMHISFSAPLYATRDQVPGGDVERERSILEQQEDVASKPEQVRGKIVQGRLEKWFGESVLVDQPWIHESSLTVGKALGQAGLVVVEFQRFALG